jgi:hypothetical protein
VEEQIVTKKYFFQKRRISPPLQPRAFVRGGQNKAGEKWKQKKVAGKSFTFILVFWLSKCTEIFCGEKNIVKWISMVLP